MNGFILSCLIALLSDSFTECQTEVHFPTECDNGDSGDREKSVLSSDNI